MKVFSFIKKNISYLINAEKYVKEIKGFIKTSELINSILHPKELGITEEKYFDKGVIVSLTTHSNRIYDVALTIESLMQQTIKPNKIILWLAENEFNLTNIPQLLLKLQERGLTISFCKDIKSYKKLIPTLIKFPNDIIITVDDDILYNYDMLENLINSYKKDTDVIHFCHGRKMKIDSKGILTKYNKWKFIIQDYQINKMNLPIGAGGILYPPKCLHSDVVREDIFMFLAPYADDIWFKSMALMKGTLSRKVITHNPIGIDGIGINNEHQQKTALSNYNLKGGNDEQIKAVFSKYNIYELLK